MTPSSIEFSRKDNKPIEPEELNFSGDDNENYLPGEIGKPKLIGESEDNFPEDLEPVDKNGKTKEDIFEEYKDNFDLSEPKLLTFDKKNGKWLIEGKDPIQWKKEMDELYDKTGEKYWDR